MHLVRHPADLTAASGGALVPTMGALHEGHLALMRRARALAQPVVISIFVNPAQFGPGEDYQRYPRTMEADLEVAEAAGVEVVFAPEVETMYPPEHPPPVGPLPDVATRPGLEDAHRPGHFAGVCQVVARLLDLVKPSVAIFGEKDYQQLLVVEAMVQAARDRWPGLRIERHPTVREADGLAASSRNARLEPSVRDRALGLFRALEAAQAAPETAEETMQRVLAEHDLGVDYAVVRDARTLGPIETPQPPARALVAARLGDVRLIDNVEVNSDQ